MDWNDRYIGPDDLYADGQVDGLWDDREVGEAEVSATHREVGEADVSATPPRAVQKTKTEEPSQKTPEPSAGAATGAEDNTWMDTWITPDKESPPQDEEPEPQADEKGVDESWSDKAFSSILCDQMNFVFLLCFVHLRAI